MAASSTTTSKFEIVRVDLNSDEAAAHEGRFDRLTERAIPLAEVEGSALWLEWESVIKRQRMHREEIRRLEAWLETREFVRSRDDDKGRLIDDLQELYDITVAEKLPRADGQPYIPHRFRQGIDRARAGADPVLLVTRMCRRQTEGFDVILNANRPHLTVESLVVDRTKPYHDLFTDRTRELSAQRLQQFPSWEPEPAA